MRRKSSSSSVAALRLLFSPNASKLVSLTSSHCRHHQCVTNGSLHCLRRRLSWGVARPGQFFTIPPSHPHTLTTQRRANSGGPPGQVDQRPTRSSTGPLTPGGIGKQRRQQRFRRARGGSTSAREASLQHRLPHGEALAKLRKLLRSHRTYCKNSITLRGDRQVDLTLQRVCLHALQSSGLVERLSCTATAFGTDSSDEVMVRLTVLCDQPEVKDMAATTSNSSGGGSPSFFSVQLPSAALRWLSAPITIPSLPVEELLALGEGDATARDPTDVWMEHCAKATSAAGTRPFPVDFFHALLGLDTPGDGSPTSDDVMEVLGLLSTLSYFKWSKDRLHLHRSGTQAVTFDDNFAALREEANLLLELQKKQRGESSGPETTGATEMARQQLTHTQGLMRHAQAILQSVPKVDYIAVDATHEGPIPVTPRTTTTTTAAIAATCTAVSTTYHVHVLDLFIGMLFRCVLAHWTVLPATCRSTFLRLSIQPWFTSDLATPLAVWFTYVQLLDQRNSGESGVSLAAQMEYVQHMRELCWPTALDVRSSIVQRAFGISASPDNVSGDTGSPAKDGVEERKGTKYAAMIADAVEAEAPQADAPTVTRLKELLKVLHASERRQRTAYELLLTCFFTLSHCRTIAGGGSTTTTAAAVGAVAEVRTMCTICVYVADLDHFTTERLYGLSRRRPRWVLLPTSSTLGSVGEVVAAQCAEPYALTRALFASAGNALAELWPPEGSKRERLLWEAWMRAVAKLCTHLASPPSGEFSASPTEAQRVLEPIRALLHRSAALRSTIAHRTLLEFLQQHTQSAPRSPEEQSASTVSDRFLQLVHLMAFLIQCDREASDAPNSGAFQTEAQTQCMMCVRALMTRWSASGTGITQAESLLKCWPPAVTAAQYKPSSSTDTATAAHLSIISECLFTPALRTELVTWVKRRAHIQQSQQRISSAVVDPLLRRWHAMLLDDDAGVHLFILSAQNFYNSFALLLERRQTEASANGGGSVDAAATHTVTLFTAEELSIVLGVLSRIHARGGTALLLKSTRPLFATLESMIGTVSGSTDGGHLQSSSKQTSTEPRVASVHERVLAMELALRKASQTHASSLSAEALVQATLLGLLSIWDLSSAMGPHLRAESAAAPISDPAGQRQQQDPSWLAELDLALERSAHLRQMCGTLVLSHFPFVIPDDGGWVGAAWPTALFEGEAGDAGGRTLHVCETDGVEIAALSLALRRFIRPLATAEVAVARSAVQASYEAETEAASMGSSPDYAASTTPVPATTATTGKLSTSVLHARHLVSMAALSMYIFLVYHPHGDRARVSERQLQVLSVASRKPLMLLETYSALLYAAAEFIPYAGVGDSGQALLWLAGAMATVPREWCAAQGPPVAPLHRTVVGTAGLQRPPASTLLSALVPPRDTAADVSSLPQWAAHAHSGLWRMGEIAFRSASARASELLSVTSTIVAARIFAAVDVAQIPQGQPVLERVRDVSGERRMLVANCNLVLAACACCPSAGEASIPSLKQLRDLRDTLTLAEVERAFLTLSQMAPATLSLHDVQAHQVLARQWGRDDIVRGLGGTSAAPARTQWSFYGVLPSTRGVPALYRHLWSSLTRRVLEHNSADAPVSLLVTSLQCGARLGCADTTIFAQLLACLLMDRAAVGVNQLTLAEWAAVVEACGASTEQRRDMAELLREFVLEVITTEVGGSDAAITTGSRNPDTPPGAVAAARCLFIEALSTVFVESDDFWATVKRTVEAWCLEFSQPSFLRECGRGAKEQDLQLSFNYAVCTAGHAGLCFPTCRSLGDDVALPEDASGNGLIRI